MLNRLGSFKSYSISKIRNLVRLYYAFYQQLDISTYITDLLSKNRYRVNDIENMSNWGYGCDNVSDKTIGLKAIFSSYYYWHIDHDFYKVTYNTGFVLNLVTIKFFNSFYAGL